MFVQTARKLRCPQPAKRGRSLCGGELSLGGAAGASSDPTDIQSGQLVCGRCEARYPILGGVAVIVPDVQGYLAAHAKGISRVVPAPQWPREHARLLKAAIRELEQDAVHIDEDLESARVLALYLMNHYLPASHPALRTGDPVLEALILEHWDHGPLEHVARAIASSEHVLELGCGVGGLARRLGKSSAYLGVDSSFASIALARHINCGAPFAERLLVPGDLLDGPVSREVAIERDADRASLDFVVGELDASPVQEGIWDACAALNAIDMLEEPDRLPEIQARALKLGGRAVQSCPYVWHPRVAQKLRKKTARETKGSADAVERLYANRFEVSAREAHVPWLFFKHARQLEIYSVHILTALKRE